MKRSKRRQRNGMWENQVSPSFVEDVPYLVSVGIMYEKERKTKTGKIRKYKTPKYLYRQKAMKEEKEYFWQKTKKYHLHRIKGHRLVYDRAVCLEDHEQDALWYDSIDFGDIVPVIRERDGLHGDGHHGDEEQDDDVKVRENGTMDIDENNNNEDGAHQDQNGKVVTPQICFGRLRFECEWEEWPDTTLESWSRIKHTAAFEEYCTEMGWNPNREWLATTKECPDEKFKEIMLNMALYAPPNTRKALKQLVLKCLDTW